VLPNTPLAGGKGGGEDISGTPVAEENKIVPDKTQLKFLNGIQYK
jgi:hypothetical protein